MKAEGENSTFDNIACFVALVALVMMIGACYGAVRPYFKYDAEERAAQKVVRLKGELAEAEIQWETEKSLKMARQKSAAELKGVEKPGFIDFITEAKNAETTVEK